jgi:hypothetical protein
MQTHFTPADALSKFPLPNHRRDVELGRRGSLILEYYAPIDHDPQQPHNQDELYFVHSGTGDFVCGEERVRFAPGDSLFVPAGVVHRFENFSADFGTWVVFYGDPGGELSLPAALAEGKNVAANSPLTRNGLIWRTQTSWLSMNAWLDTLNEAQATDMKDPQGWAVKDHVMHLVPWLNGMVTLLDNQGKYAGMGVTCEQYKLGFDPVNEILFKRHQHRSFYDARWQLQHTYQQFMARLMSLPNDAVLLPYLHYDPSSPKTDPVYYWLWGNSGGHFYEHMPWMQKIVNGNPEA